MDGGGKVIDVIQDVEQLVERSEEEEIIERLKESSGGRGEFYYDGHFGGTPAALYRDEQFVPDYDADLTAQVSWLRPHEFTASPEYFIDGSSSGDVVQGRLGDCWIMGSLAAVANHPDQLIENLFGSDPDDFKKYGVYTCRFYKDGAWVEVVTDTRIPCAPGGSGSGAEMVGLRSASTPSPMYGRTRDLGEQWVMLLEKAYAKAHGSYEALHGGSVAEALVDFTGGSSEKIVLTEPPVQASVKNGKLWKKLRRYASWRYLMGCSHSEADAGAEDEMPNGLFKNHCYTVLGFKQLGDLQFVRVRNPWGMGEWRGAWSDSSTHWDDYPEVLSEMMEDPTLEWDRDAKDGTFWMTFDDFAANFNKVYVLRLFPEAKFAQYCAHGEWAGKTAGGSHRAMIDRDGAAGGADDKAKDAAKDKSGDDADGEVLYHAHLKKHTEPLEGREVGTTIRMDGDPYWFNNPQFRVSVGAGEPADLYVSLMQQDRRTAKRLRDNFPVAFEVVRMRKTAEHPRCWELDPSELVADSASATFSSRFPQREVSKGSIKLDPGHSYNIVPHTSVRGREGKFFVRVFSPKSADVKIAAVPEAKSVYLPGVWERQPERETAGGPLRLMGKGAGLRDNPKWCQNPQFHLSLPEELGSNSVDVKLVLRRTDNAADASDKKRGQRRGSGASDEPANVFVGLTIVKAAAPEADGAASRRRDSHAVRTNALGEPMPTKASSLKRPPASAAQSAAAVNPEDGGDGLGTQVDRKMVVASTEWCELSDYTSKTVATTLLSGLTRNRAPHGLLVVPTLSEPGAKGTFVLEVHSDAAVKVEELPESTSKTCAGEWTEKEAGGSHLNMTFSKNPRYHLRLTSPHRAKVKISLSRPEAEWKGKCAKDMVGCMMGFYVFFGPHPDPHHEMGCCVHDGKPWGESAFVPMSSVSTPTNFYLEPLADDGSGNDVYTIMPATFEPGKVGSFFLSVVADCEFVLKRDTSTDRKPRN